MQATWEPSPAHRQYQIVVRDQAREGSTETETRQSEALLLIDRVGGKLWWSAVLFIWGACLHSKQESSSRPGPLTVNVHPRKLREVSPHQRPGCWHQPLMVVQLNC